jgi:hypothetical protein
MIHQSLGNKMRIGKSSNNIKEEQNYAEDV